MRLNRDEVLGLGAMAAAAAYWAAADRIPVSLLADSVGADGVPKMLAVALGLFGALLAGSRRLRPASAGAGEPEAPEVRRRQHRRAAGLLGGLAVYVLLLPYLGYPLALLIFAGAIYGGARPTAGLGLVAVLAGLGFWLFFTKFLGVLMPLGLWVPGG